MWYKGSILLKNLLPQAKVFVVLKFGEAAAIQLPNISPMFVQIQMNPDIHSIKMPLCTESDCTTHKQGTNL
jgi:hypothetical protein